MTARDKPRHERARPDHRDRSRRPAGKAHTAGKESGGDAPVVEQPDAEPERISKLLARAGIASRRDVERMIVAGRVKLNGMVLETPAVNVTLADRIEVDETVIDGIERTRLWLYHKPAGLVSTNRDPEGRATIFEKLPEALPRVMTIGRLDINTEGLLLLTNDGGLARALELPSTGWLRRYRVRAHGDIDQDALDRLKEGIAVDGVFYGPIEAILDRKQGTNVWITMGLREGKNREVKNVLGVLGLEVNRLIRLSYGPFQLADLAEGEVREVRGRTLRDQLGPRLIAEAGADFDAPISHPQDEPKSADKPGREPRNRSAREKPAERNERLRGRLDTRRDSGTSGAQPDKQKKKPAGVQRRRAANVWIAPGARPMGPKKTAEKAEAEARQAAKDERQRQRRDNARSGSAPERQARSERTGPAKGGAGKPGASKATGKPNLPSGKRAGSAGQFDKPRGEKWPDGKVPARPARGRDGKTGKRTEGRRDDADRRR